jgi:hypothetical protein
VLSFLLLSIVSLPVPALIVLNVSTQALIVLGLPTMLVVHDLRTARRLSAATLWGVSGYVAAMAGAVVVASSPAGQALIQVMAS